MYMYYVSSLCLYSNTSDFNFLKITSCWTNWKRDYAPSGKLQLHNLRCFVLYFVQYKLYVSQFNLNVTLNAINIAFLFQCNLKVSSKAINISFLFYLNIKVSSQTMDNSFLLSLFSKISTLIYINAITHEEPSTIIVFGLHSYHKSKGQLRTLLFNIVVGYFAVELYITHEEPSTIIVFCLHSYRKSKGQLRTLLFNIVMGGYFAVELYMIL